MVTSYFRDIYFRSGDGLTLYARDYPGPASDSPIVVCLHGLSRNSRDFEDLAPLLQRSHRVIVPDQRGRGRSDADPRVERYAAQTYILDTLRLLDELTIDTFSIVGTSMGGLMAMGISAVAPSRLSRVVINDIGPVIANRGLDRIKSSVGSAMIFPDWTAAADHLARVNGVAFPNYGAADWLRFAARACSQQLNQVALDYDPNITVPLSADNSEVSADDLWAMFATLSDKPLLLIRGALSDLLDPACAAEMHRRHGAMQLLEVSDVGHAPMLDEHGVSEALIKFLNLPAAH
ncbi:MAG: alpha/beta hydrolase [Halieaceae bacterium]|jgi:pimeloyl-ACP methyl ester carboxylesterase|nr:alpha/beta hydrolase [Halieaceae bacterium]